jgi:hypothetical protein
MGCGQMKNLLDYTGIPSVLGPEAFGEKGVSFGYPTISMDTYKPALSDNKELENYLENRFGVDILKLPQDYFTKRFGYDIVGHREGKKAYIKDGLDPVTEKYVMAHEALPYENHEKLQADVEDLFKNIKDWPALYRSIEIGEKLGKEEGWKR